MPGKIPASGTTAPVLKLVMVSHHLFFSIWHLNSGSWNCSGESFCKLSNPSVPDNSSSQSLQSWYLTLVSFSWFHFYVNTHWSCLSKEKGFVISSSLTLGWGAFKTLWPSCWEDNRGLRGGPKVNYFIYCILEGNKLVKPAICAALTPWLHVQQWQAWEGSPFSSRSPWSHLRRKQVRGSLTGWVRVRRVRS